MDEKKEPALELVPQEEAGHRMAWNKLPWLQMVLAGLMLALLALGAAIWVELSQMREQMNHIQDNILGIHSSVNASVSNALYQLQELQKKEGGIVDQYHYEYGPMKNGKVELTVSADLKECQDNTQVAFLWETAGQSQKIAAQRQEGNRFSATVTLAADTEDLSVTVLSQDGGSQKSELMTSIPVRSYYVLEPSVNGFLSSSWSSGIPRMELQPQVQVWGEGSGDRKIVSARAVLTAGDQEIAAQELNPVDEILWETNSEEKVSLPLDGSVNSELLWTVTITDDQGTVYTCQSRYRLVTGGESPDLEMEEDFVLTDTTFPQ